MTSNYYILDEEESPVIETDLTKWGQFMEKDARRSVKREEVHGYLVSTVFLGLDHNHSLEGPPILWETMVFRDGSFRGLIVDRCSGSREQAEAMHDKMVERLNKGKNYNENHSLQRP